MSTTVIPAVLRLAILNNLGEIYYRLHQYDHMVNIYDHMENLWSRLAVLAGGPFLDQVETHGLMWNARFLKRPGTAAAA